MKYFDKNQIENNIVLSRFEIVENLLKSNIPEVFLEKKSLNHFAY